MRQIRTAAGQFEDIESLQKYILEKCAEHKSQKRAFAFALIVYNFDDPHITKILEDEKYFNALDYIAGEYLTVFYLHSEYLQYQSDRAKKRNSVRYEFGLQRLNGPDNLSPKYIGEKLFNQVDLPSPSLIFFNTSENVITDYSIARLRVNEIEKGFNELLKIIKIAVNGLINVKEENRINDKEIFSLLKNSIEGSEFWKNAKSGFDKMMKTKDFISFWKIW